MNGTKYFYLKVNETYEATGGVTITPRTRLYPKANERIAIVEISDGECRKLKVMSANEIGEKVGLVIKGGLTIK